VKKVFKRITRKERTIYEAWKKGMQQQEEQLWKLMALRYLSLLRTYLVPGLTDVENDKRQRSFEQSCARSGFCWFFKKQKVP
jgi:hypothetical protein